MDREHTSLGYIGTSLFLSLSGKIDYLSNLTRVTSTQ